MSDEKLLKELAAMEYLSVYQLSTLTGISLSQIKRWTQDGKISFLDCGKQKRYRTMTVLAELSEMQRKAEGPATLP